MQRRFIISLKEPIDSGEGTVHVISCDYVFADEATPAGLMEYRIDNMRAFVPIHNLLGVHPNDFYKIDLSQLRPEPNNTSHLS